MANLNGYVLTQAGKNLFAKSSSGECKVVFTKAKIGEAETSIDELLTKNDLVGTKLKLLDIVSSRAEENKFTIITTVTNSGLEEHFYIRQLGIFAKGLSVDELDTEILPEKLIAVAYDTSPDVIPAETNNIPYTKQMNIGFSINNADKCEIDISLAGVVTSEVLENHNNDTKAHSNLIKSIFGIEEATEGNIKEKIEEYAKKVCLPLSGGIMEGLVSLFTGSTISTPTQQDNSKKITNTEWVQTWVKAFVSELSANIEVETQSDGHFSCPALGITGLMAQNGYICLGKLFGNLILQWGLGNTPNVIFYPVSFTRFIGALIANDVGNGNSAIGCTRSGLNAFYPTATNGNGVGFTYISIGI